MIFIKELPLVMIEKHTFNERRTAKVLKFIYFIITRFDPRNGRSNKLRGFGSSKVVSSVSS